MNSPRSKKALAVAAALGLVLFTALPSAASNAINPKAAKIVRAMADHLGTLKEVRVAADVDNEIIDLTGQKLQLSSDVDLVMQRPGKLYVHRHGPFADVQLYFDGRQLSIHNKDNNTYSQFDVSSTVDAAFTELEMNGLDAPGADLLRADSYRALVGEAATAEYRGTAFVNGVECDYITFRGAQVDWQLWVRHGDKPVPMKYVITTKWLTGAPQYSVRFREWNTSPRIAGDQFKFTAPTGAKKTDSLGIKAGELLGDGGSK